MNSRLSGKLQHQTDDLIASVKNARAAARPNLPDVVGQAERHVRSLLFDADLARLDGKNMRAADLRREAARLQRLLPR